MANKNFTQVPNVFIDRCALSGEIRDFFICLLRHVGHKGGVFTGSIRELATQLNLSKDKTHRSVQMLNAAHLLETSSGKIALNTNDLWQLNTIYDKGGAVPYWTDLKQAVSSVANLRQNNDDNDSEVSQVCDNLSQVCDNVVAKTRQSVSSLRQSVSSLRQTKRAVKPPVEPSEEVKLAPPNTIKIFNTNTNTINTCGETPPTSMTEQAVVEKDEVSQTSEKQLDLLPDVPQPTPPPQKRKGTSKPKTEKPTQTPLTLVEEIILSPEEKAVYDEWCKMKWFRGVPPKITDRLKSHCRTLAAYHPTESDFYAVRAYAEKNGNAKYKGWELGNVVYWYPKYASSTYTVQDTPKEEKKQQDAPVVELTNEERRARMNEKRIANLKRENPRVFWTTTGDKNTMDSDDLETLKTWRFMSWEEAEKYGFNYRLKLVGFQESAIQGRIAGIMSKKARETVAS